MNNNDEKIDVVASSSNIIAKEEPASDAESVTALIEGIVSPLLKSQETAEQEKTKRTSILAEVANKAIYALIIIAGLILLLAGYALKHGYDSFAETIVIALLAFMGGLGVGKASNK